MCADRTARFLSLSLAYPAVIGGVLHSVCDVCVGVVLVCAAAVHRHRTAAGLDHEGVRNPISLSVSRWCADVGWSQVQAQLLVLCLAHRAGDGCLRGPQARRVRSLSLSVSLSLQTSCAVANGTAGKCRGWTLVWAGPRSSDVRPSLSLTLSLSLSPRSQHATDTGYGFESPRGEDVDSSRLPQEPVRVTNPLHISPQRRSVAAAAAAASAGTP
jgi:hypothetical protein